MKVDGNFNLPQPLDKKQLTEYFLKYHNGDERAKEIIITHNIRLVFDVIERYFKDGPYDKNELFSVGLIGLITSVNTFDLTRNTNFSTYANRVIHNEIIDFMKKARNYIHDESIEKTLYTISKGNNSIKLIDVFKDPYADFVEEYEKKEITKIIRGLVDALPEYDKKIIILHFYEKLSQHEIAKIFNCSQTHICHVITRVLKEMNIKLHEFGIIETPLKLNNLKGTNKQKLQIMYGAIENNVQDKTLIMNQIIDELELSKRDKKLINLYLQHFDDKSINQAEIGKRIGLSQRRVSILLTEILKKIELKLQDLGILETIEEKNKQKTLK